MHILASIVARSAAHLYRQLPESHLVMPRLVPLLAPVQARPPLVMQEAGLKKIPTVRKRCKDCQIHISDDVMHITCPTHPRHRQMVRQVKDKHRWTMTHATQGAHRSGPREGRGRREMMTQAAFHLDFH